MGSIDSDESDHGKHDGPEPWEDRKGEHEKEKGHPKSGKNDGKKEGKGRHLPAFKLTRLNIYILFVCIVVVVAIIAAVGYINNSPPAQPALNDTNTYVPPVTGTISKDACYSLGGQWNDCGSACRGAPQGTVCVQVCVPQCDWYSSAALLIKKDAVYGSKVSCKTQPNGIESCWMNGAA